MPPFNIPISTPSIPPNTNLPSNPDIPSNPSIPSNPNDTSGENSQINYVRNETDYLYNVKTLQEKLPAILDDFKKYYVFFNKNPTYSEYQTIFENIKGNLNSINSDLFKILNDIERNTNNISDNFTEVNKIIKDEKNKNTKLKYIYDKINNNLNGSRTMIDEYKQIYNEKYLNNVFIFIGIIVSGVILTKVFSKNNNTITNVNIQK